MCNSSNTISVWFAMMASAEGFDANKVGTNGSAAGFNVVVDRGPKGLNLSHAMVVKSNEKILIASRMSRFTSGASDGLNNPKISSLA